MINYLSIIKGNLENTVRRGESKSELKKVHSEKSNKLNLKHNFRKISKSKFFATPSIK